MNCWEFMKCGREKGGNQAGELGVCPSWPKHGHVCAHIAGTLGGHARGVCAKKKAGCLQCDFYRSEYYDHQASLALAREYLH